MNKDTVDYVKKNLSDSDLKTARKVGLVKLIKAMTRAYNNLCAQCKRMAVNNPRSAITDYCPVCQEVINRELSPLQK